MSTTASRNPDQSAQRATDAAGVSQAPETAEATVGRRERKKLQTRQSLRNSALRLFAERGFDQTTVEDITEAADVASRTFFLHFASKEDVLLGDGHQRAERFLAAVAARPADEEPLEALRQAVRESVTDPEADHEEWMLSARLMEESHSLLARNLERYATAETMLSEEIALRTGTSPDDMYPRLVTACAMTALRVAFTIWYHGGGHDDLASVIDQAFHQLATALTPNGLAP